MITDKIKSELTQIVGKERFFDDPEEILSFSYDAYILTSEPDVVIYPETTEDVSGIMKIAHREKIPVTCRGSGTNISAASLPVKKGIALCFTKMNKIIEVNTRDRYVIVEPGLINGELQKVLAKEKFFYPPDPGSMNVSTIGGNIAQNAGGPRCLKYGVTSDYVLAMEVVLASGKIVRFGSRNVKDVTGYKLSSLFCGSEGTLGIITEATLRVVPIAESHRTMLATYDDLEDTANTVADIIGSGILPVAMELMDKTVINVVADASGMSLPREAEGMLLIEVDGVEEAVEKEMGRITEKARANGARDVTVARTQKESDDLWAARRLAYGAFARLAPNCIVEDVTVPVSNVPKMIKATREIVDRYQLHVGILAHAGDGNMHPLIAHDPKDKDELKRIEQAAKEIFETGVSLGGTLSGEHGIGLAKAEFLPLVMNQDTLDLMADIKQTLDPNGILNPGKFI
jgi:glycolate oxidase